MTLFWAFCAALLAVVWVLTIVDIVRRHHSAGAMVGWIVVVLLVPYVGAIIYWVMRKPVGTEAEQAYLAQASAREQRRR